MYKSGQRTIRKSSQKARKILFETSEQYDNPRQEPVDDFRDSHTTSDDCENIIGLKDNFQDTL